MLAFAPLHDAVGAAGRALTWITALLEPLAGDAATAAAIVVLTVVVRLLISPLTLAQVRGERRRAALAPEVRELQRRYADDPTRLQGELFALYRANGANPVSGCLPLLLQAPVLLVTYRLFATADGGTGLLAEQLAGVPLGHHLGDGWGGRVLPLLPYTTVLVALVLPLAAVIYLVTTTAWSAGEQAVLRRPRPAPAR
ncbi:membrane protein insertase YidC [Micromonospora sp. CPCC 205546]|uniref:YidC/Oxa1 family membrane protein insertase n=1 Tax=Micromonospora sp. CPCC 205546 TaxID=3122397 RepID=UPI002FF1C327